MISASHLCPALLTFVPTLMPLTLACILALLAGASVALQVGGVGDPASKHETPISFSLKESVPENDPHLGIWWAYLLMFLQHRAGILFESLSPAESASECHREWCSMTPLHRSCRMQPMSSLEIWQWVHCGSCSYQSFKALVNFKCLAVILIIIKSCPTLVDYCYTVTFLLKNMPLCPWTLSSPYFQVISKPTKSLKLFDLKQHSTKTQTKSTKRTASIPPSSSLGGTAPQKPKYLWSCLGGVLIAPVFAPRLREQEMYLVDRGGWWLLGLVFSFCFFCLGCWKTGETDNYL